jgi:hypothetical protein
MSNCQTCGEVISPDTKCYHRCTECGHPFYGFFDDETGVKDDYRCTICKEPFIYSWSLVSNFMNCPKYAMFNVELGRSISSLAMKFGTCLHKSLDKLQDTKDLDLAIDLFRLDFIGNLDIDSMRTPDLGEKILREFWKKYADHQFMTAKGANEKSGAIEIRPGLLYSGKIDRIVDGNVIDYKSTSFFGRENFERTYNMSHQFTGYQHIASMITGQSFDDINVWLIKVSKGTKRRSAAELSDGREPYDDACDFKILPQRRRPHQVERFLQTIDYYVRWWNECRRTGFYPEQTNYCFHYQRDCMYLDLCELSIPQALEQVKYYFPLRAWDPLKGEEVVLQEQRRVGR